MVSISTLLSIFLMVGHKRQNGLTQKCYPIVLTVFIRRHVGAAINSIPTPISKLHDCHKKREIKYFLEKAGC